jgi:putative endonuclease
MRYSYVYMLASRRNGTLYIGVTSNLVRRVYEHRSEAVSSFTQEYQVKRLAWYEVHEDIQSAITREKQLKKWNRAWKIGLIERNNPVWRDLYPDII